MANAQTNPQPARLRSAANAASNVVDASGEPGSTADAKIMAACQSLPPTGGTIDTCGFGATVQTIASSVTCGGPSNPVTIMTCAETTFVPLGSSTTMFVLEDGTALQGTLTVDVTGTPGWSGAVVANDPTVLIPSHGTTKTRVGQVNCWGRGNTTGDCIRFIADSGARVSFVSVAGVQVDGMANGILLFANETSQGVYGWVNGNWFHNILCNGTLNCMNLQANGTSSSTQVSQNHFLQPQVELLDARGLHAITAFGTGGGAIYFNEFSGLTPFDAYPSDNIINLGSNTQGTQVTGFLCLYSCGGGSASDAGIRNVITDWYHGVMNTDIPIMNGAGNVQGYIIAGNNGAEFDLPGSNSLRIYSGNGGLEVIGGEYSDKSLYLNNLSNAGPFVFNAPLRAGNGGVGGVQVNPGDGSHVGHVSFLDANGNEHGSIGGNAINQAYLDIYSPGTTRHYGNFSVQSGSFQMNGVSGTIAVQGTPRSSSDTCTPPALMYDSRYVYTCIAINTWRRTPSTSF